MKTTVVIGASPNASRYAHKAVVSLASHGHHVEPVGLRNGTINGIEIHTDKPAFDEVDTVTLYVGPANQPAWYDYILSLNPRRVIFNPGTENKELLQMLRERGIETEQACTLVLLATNGY